MTQETCIQCDAETGRAGRYDDSLYAGDHGPYCESCWDDLRETQADEIDRMTVALIAAEKRGRLAGLRVAAGICAAQAESFLSPQYATSQPLSSVAERVACKICADAIQALIDAESKPGKGDAS